MSTDRYVSPLSERYASKEMQYIFSPDMKFRTWRRLWIALAETEKELGLNITQEQIDELKAHAEDINYDVAKERERQVRHDVMSHVYAYGVQCPKAKGIIHLGATSCYVGDNTDIIVMTEALKLVKKKLVNVIAELSAFADKYKDQPTLAFTHFQPAQPTTVGKRATLWTQEFLLDLEDLEYVLGTMKLLGSKGTTGTQASFLELFDGDQETIDKIDPMIAQKMGFKQCYPVSGQTYSRKVDTRVMNVLAGIAASAHKMSNDIRLLQHLKEVEEPFEKSQIGSSAMAYKRNPMRSERIASLSRYVMVDALNPAITSATQWFERTLDDSANKRLSIPEGFLAIDGILDLCLNVVDGLVVYPKVIEKHMMAELPFMATSCCPAWSVMAKKLFPEHAKCISMALTPMTLTARLIKQHNPDARVVFIGPCAAKKLEAMRRSVRSEVDFVLTFEEMTGIFSAKHVDLENIEEDPAGVSDASTDGRNFAVAGGVAQAVVNVIKRDHPDQEVKVANAEGLKECRQLLKLATLGKYPGYLLEGMACPGGCVAGAGTMQAIKKSQTSVGLYAKQSTHKTSSETEYIKELNKLVD